MGYIRFRMLKSQILLALTSLSLHFCSTKESSFPKQHLSESPGEPIYSETLDSNEYLQPIVKESTRPTKEGSIYYVILRDKVGKKILRSIAILVEDKSMNLKPEEYFHYPIYYTVSTSKHFRFWHHYNMAYDIRRAADNSPVYMPVYASASVVSLAAFGIAYVASTGTAFIVGLGKGTYEFTEDILEGVIISNEEIVLAYNDYLYDEKNRLKTIATYLPYRSISKTVIPLYDREGKKQIGQMYPSSKPILLSQMDFTYVSSSSNPKSVSFTEYLPKTNKKIISLPMKGKK